MAVTRRSFLVGAGSIITAAYVQQAMVYVSDTGRPMITQNLAWRVDNPGEVKTIVCEPFEGYWRLHLGQPHFEVPEPPQLIDNLRFHGYALDTQKQIDAVCVETGWLERDLFSPMDGYAWEDQWEHTFSPEAHTFEFLQRHSVFPHGQLGRREGEVFFEAFPNPMSSARWVEVHGLLSLSLLQARLNELKLTTQVVDGHPRQISAVRRYSAPCQPLMAQECECPLAHCGELQRRKLRWLTSGSKGSSS